MARIQYREIWTEGSLLESKGGGGNVRLQRSLRRLLGVDRRNRSARARIGDFGQPASRSFRISGDEEVLFLTDIFPEGYSGNRGRAKKWRNVRVFGCGSGGFGWRKTCAWMAGAKRVMGGEFSITLPQLTHGKIPKRSTRKRDRIRLKGDSRHDRRSRRCVLCDAVGMEASESLKDKWATIWPRRSGLALGPHGQRLAPCRRGGLDKACSECYGVLTISPLGRFSIGHPPKFRSAL